MSKMAQSKLFFGFLYAVAGVTLIVLIFIIGFILVRGIPHLSWGFLSNEPTMMGKEGGILSVIVGTLYVTLLAILIATPIGVMGAIYFSEYAREGMTIRIIRFFTEVLAGIPSILFGLFGFAFFVIALKLGWSILSCGLTLALMILPTILRSTEEALKTVPQAYREGSMALGGSKWHTISHVVLPCCRSGIVTGVILGLGRAVGETAAVMLTVGGALNMPTSIMDTTRTMALHLYTLASEGISDQKTYATAALLIILVLMINTAANQISKRALKEER